MCVFNACYSFVRFVTEEGRTRALDATKAGVVIDGLKLFAALPRYLFQLLSFYQFMYIV